MSTRGWLSHGNLIGQSRRACEKRPLCVMVIEGDPQAQGSHLLFVVVKDDEVSIDTVILCNEVKQGDANIAQRDKVLPFHLLVEGIAADPVIQS